MSARETLDALSHSRKANQLRDQLQGLLPASLQPDNVKAGAAAVANEAGDGMGKLLDYVRLAADYWEPAAALLQRLLRRAPEVVEELAPPAKRRFGVRPFVAVGIAVGLGLAAYGVTRLVQDLKRDA